MDWEGPMPSLFYPEERKDREELFAFLKKVPDDERSRRRMIEDIQQGDPSVPEYVRKLRAGPAEEIVELPRWDDDRRQSTKWQIIRFIKGLPESQVDRHQIIDYMDDWGFDPRALHRQGLTYFSVWFHVTEPGWMVVTHVTILAVIL